MELPEPQQELRDGPARGCSRPGEGPGPGTPLLSGQVAGD